MNLLKKLLLIVIASAGVMGSAYAQNQTFNLGTVSSTATVQTDFFTTSSTSFADILNFTVGAGHQAILTNAVSFAPDGTPAGATDVSNLTLTLFSGSNATGPVLGTISSSNGTMIDLSSPVLATGGDFSALVAGTANGTLGGGYSFSVAAMPEPADWMLLLSGLVVVGFIARRKTSLLAG